MQEINERELQKLQIQILDVTAEFCEKKGIRYWLTAGTLLGAVRHNGYIPWDDDIDIGMLRPDFDRFIREFNSYTDRYEVKCIDTDPDFCLAFAKVLDKQTILYEPDEKGIKLAVYIDVFVYDNVPANPIVIKKMYILRDFWRDCNLLRTKDFEPLRNRLTKAFIGFLRILVKPFPRNFFALGWSKHAKKYSKTDTKFIGDFTGYGKMVCDISIFDELDEHEFEGKTYKIPKGYDQWLTRRYGDYMRLPPAEKRVSTHRFKAYYKDSAPSSES